ncbi:MAG: hypothetical protein PWP72_411 [Thermoanaerobacter sp.]|nr:hypothetical protein [Thermoanaerobacter sp.]
MAGKTASISRSTRPMELNAAVAAARPWTYQVAFWGLAALLFFPPFFRGLFFPPEQEMALMGAAIIFWFTWLWKHGRRDYSFLTHPLDYFTLALPLVYVMAAFGAVNYAWPWMKL